MNQAKNNLALVLEAESSMATSQGPPYQLLQPRGGKDDHSSSDEANIEVSLLLHF